MWCIAVVLLAFPTEWRPYAMYGHMALAAATLLVCGAKLHAIVVQLASRWAAGRGAWEVRHVGGWAAAALLVQLA